MHIVPKPPPEPIQDRNEQETRSGLRRLADLIRDKRKPPDYLDNQKNGQAGHEKTEAKTIAVVEVPAGIHGHLSDQKHAVPLDLESPQMVQFLLHWQEKKKRKLKSMADVMREELFRRRAIEIYKRASRRASL